MQNMDNDMVASLVCLLYFVFQDDSIGQCFYCTRFKHLVGFQVMSGGGLHTFQLRIFYAFNELSSLPNYLIVSQILSFLFCEPSVIFTLNPQCLQVMF